MGRWLPRKPGDGEGKGQALQGKDYLVLNTLQPHHSNSASIQLPSLVYVCHCPEQGQGAGCRLALEVISAMAPPPVTVLLIMPLPKRVTLGSSSVI